MTPVLKNTQNTDANFTGIRTRSDGILHHTNVNFLQLFCKWYKEEYLDKDLAEDLTEIFTESVWERYARKETQKLPSST